MSHPGKIDNYSIDKRLLAASFHVSLEQSDKLRIPELVSADLCRWLLFAVGDVSLGPLFEGLGDLFDASDWVVLVVSGVNDFIVTIEELIKAEIIVFSVSSSTG